MIYQLIKAPALFLLTTKIYKKFHNHYIPVSNKIRLKKSSADEASNISSWFLSYLAFPIDFVPNSNR